MARREFSIFITFSDTYIYIYIYIYIYMYLCCFEISCIIIVHGLWLNFEATFTILNFDHNQLKDKYIYVLVNEPKK